MIDNAKRKRIAKQNKINRSKSNDNSLNTVSNSDIPHKNVPDNKTYASDASILLSQRAPSWMLQQPYIRLCFQYYLLALS